MKEAKEMKKFFQTQPDQKAEEFKTQAVVKRLELECAVCLEIDGEPRNICIECAKSYHVDCMDDPQFRFDDEKSKSTDSPQSPPKIRRRATCDDKRQKVELAAGGSCWRKSGEQIW